MNKKSMKLKSVIYLILITLFSGNLNLYSDISEALLTTKQNYQNDLGLISAFITENIGKLVAYNGASEINLPAETLLTNRFELGLVLHTNVYKSNIKVLKNLNLQIINGEPIIDWTTVDDTYFPFGGILIFTKVGVSDTFDFGIKFGGVPSELNFENIVFFRSSIFGAETRLQIVHRPTLPFDIATSIGITNSNGYLELKTSETITNGYVTSESINYEQVTKLSKPVLNTNWNFNLVTVRTIISAPITIFKPYAGIQLDFNYAKSYGKFSTPCEITVTEVGNPSNIMQANYNLEGANYFVVPIINHRVLLGLEINLDVMQFWLSTDISIDNYSLMLGGRIKI